MSALSTLAAVSVVAAGGLASIVSASCPLSGELSGDIIFIAICGFILAGGLVLFLMVRSSECTSALVGC